MINVTLIQFPFRIASYKQHTKKVYCQITFKWYYFVLNYFHLLSCFYLYNKYLGKSIYRRVSITYSVYQMKQLTIMIENLSMTSVNYLLKLINLKKIIKNTKSVNVSSRNLICSSLR